MLDFNVSVGLGGWALVIIGALMFGIVLQLVGQVRFGYEWVATAIGAFAGAIVLSEFIVDWRAFQPVWDELALIPALIGGVVVGAIVALIVRYATGGSVMREAAA